MNVAVRPACFMSFRLCHTKFIDIGWQGNIARQVSGGNGSNVWRRFTEEDELAEYDVCAAD